MKSLEEPFFAKKSDGSRRNSYDTGLGRDDGRPNFLPRCERSQPLRERAQDMSRAGAARQLEGSGMAVQKHWASSKSSSAVQMSLLRTHHLCIYCSNEASEQGWLLFER